VSPKPYEIMNNSNPRDNTGPPTLAYVRSATSSHDWHRQLKAIRNALGESAGDTPKIVVFADLSSGLTPFEQRQGGGTLLQYCRAHPRPPGSGGTILIADLARLSRACEEFHRLIPLLRDLGWHVRVASG
jgi:DNA invertase Pin-like site-specific DNA recombinase